MRLLVTTLVCLLTTLLGAVGSLYLAMWGGGLISGYEAGAYIGLAFTFFLVPVGALVAGWIAATLVWRSYGRSAPKA